VNELTSDLPDIQDSRDDRGIPIDSVGISGLRVPLRFCDGEVDQSGIATADVSVVLPATERGTHMSRMVIIAEQLLADLDPRQLEVPLKSAAALLNVDSVSVSCGFPLGTPVSAPVSGAVGTQVHDVHLSAKFGEGGLRLVTSVSTDITTLCPCSQAVSDYGAHNQRSRVTVTLYGDDVDPYPMPVLAIVGLIRSAGSAPVYPVVKRQDERHITMQAFEAPAFVEDVVRDLSAQLRVRGLAHSVESKNIESIHSHDAVASLRWPTVQQD
jgi:GTP cyclohydrolase I